MGDQSSVTQIPNELLNVSKFGEFIDAALDYKAKAEWKGDKRFFITFLPNIANIAFLGVDSTDRRDVINYNIRTKLSGSYGVDNTTTPKSTGKITRNLAELSTAEIVSQTTNQNNKKLGLSTKFPLQQNYIAREHGSQEAHNHFATPGLFISGSYLISKMNDDNPSLLVELNKTQQLPNGLGDKEFIVIPDNLHPFIKDNIEYFLTRAGINVSGDSSQYVVLDETNRNLP